MDGEKVSEALKPGLALLTCLLVAVGCGAGSDADLQGGEASSRQGPITVEANRGHGHGQPPKPETHASCRPQVKVNQCGRWRGVELEATNEHRSHGRDDEDERCLCRQIDWRVPEALEPEEPGPVSGIAELNFDYRGKDARCIYHAKSRRGVPASRYELQTCSHDIRAGDLVQSRYFELELHGGWWNDSVRAVLGERRFVVSDPALGNATLRVPMDAAPASQEFALTREEMVPPGIFIAQGKGGVVSAGPSLSVTAVGAGDHYEFAAGTCAELDLPIDLQASGLAERPPDVTTSGQAVRAEFSSRTPEAVATLTPVEGGVIEVDLERKVATVCVNHLSTFGYMYDDSKEVLVAGNLSFMDKSGSQAAPIRDAPVEIWRFRPRFLGIWSWGTGPDAVGGTDSAGNYGVVLPYVGRAFEYAMRILASNYAAAAHNNFDQQMYTEPQAFGSVMHRIVYDPGTLEWNFTVSEGDSWPTYADPRLLFNVIDTARVAHDYADRHRDLQEQDTIPQVWITVTPLTASTYYDCAVTKKIWLQPSYADDDLTVLHEYTHFLQQHISGMPCQPTEHDGCVAKLFDGAGYAMNSEHAWQEGFADYLAQAIFSEEEARSPGRLCQCSGPLGTSPIWKLNSRETCDWLIGPPLPFYITGEFRFAPDMFEDYTAAILWALETGPNSTWDRVSGQGDLIFKIFDHDLDPDNGSPMPNVRQFFSALINRAPWLGYDATNDVFRHFLVGQGDDAAASIDVKKSPPSVVSGRKSWVAFDMTNIGTYTWNSQLGYRLVPTANNTLPWDVMPAPLLVHTPSGLDVHAKVAPGVHIEVYADFTAPCVSMATPLTVEAVMQKPDGSPFGDVSPRRTVLVQPASTCDNNGVCDNACGVAETCASCPNDCGRCCGNGICEAGFGEDFVSCGADCTDPCAAHDSCEDCGSDPACGWCSDGSRCRSGEKGPIAGPSCGAEWRKGEGMCPDLEILTSDRWYHLGPGYSAELFFPGSSTDEINVTDRTLPLDPAIPSPCPFGARRVQCVVTHVSGGGHCEFVGWASEDPHDCGCVVHVGANALEWEQMCHVSVIGRQ